MKLTLILERIANSSRLKIFKGYEEIYSGWKGNLSDQEEIRKRNMENLEVVNMVVTRESGGSLVIMTQEGEA